MNAAQLLAHFERISEAPDAIARLRRFMLDLAVRGKLVPQDPHDEPASELLKRIAKEKASLVSSGAIRRERLLPPVSRAEMRWPLPNGWAWARLGALSKLVTSGSRDWAQRYASEGAIFVRMGNLSKNHYGLRLDHIQHVSPPADGEGTRTRLEAGDILISITGDVGMLGLVPEGFGEAYINQHTAVVRPMSAASGRFLPELFRSPFAQDQFNEPQRGIKNSFRLTDITGFVVPVPPLAEQHRIIASVDESMALCDRLEMARTEREARRDRLVSASLARLNTPDADPDAFTTHARFTLDNLPALTTRPDQIKQLRQTILNLAVHGGFSVADTWQKTPVKLGSVASLQNGYAFKSEWFAKSGVRLLRNSNVGHGSIYWDEVVNLSEKMAHEFERFQLNDGDIVLSLDRPFIVTGTKVARVTAEDLPALLLQRVGRFVLSQELHADYLLIWINSPCFSFQIDPGRSNGVPHISSKQVEGAELFLPPVAEQRRIVAKVDGLMTVCDQLQASLLTTDTARRRLLESLLAEALAPVTEIQRDAA